MWSKFFQELREIAIIIRVNPIPNEKASIIIEEYIIFQMLIAAINKAKASAQGTSQASIPTSIVFFVFCGRQHVQEIL